MNVTQNVSGGHIVVTLVVHILNVVWWLNVGHIVGQIFNVIKMCPLGTLGSHAVCTHYVFTMCPLGIWVLVPSVNEWVQLALMSFPLV